jgi:hypothetical protein
MPLRSPRRGPPGWGYVGNVKPDEAVELMVAGAARLIDVRTPEERKFVGYVPDSILERRSQGLAPDCTAPVEALSPASVLETKAPGTRRSAHAISSASNTSANQQNSRCTRLPNVSFMPTSTPTNCAGISLGRRRLDRNYELRICI